MAFVHLSEEQQAAEMFTRYGLADVSRISDPQRVLYRAFDLQRASLSQVFGAKVWLRGLEALTQGHTVGMIAGDARQMPGVFLLHNEKIIRTFRHESAADRPDYRELAQPLYD